MVALTKDATKLVQQINYDPATNQCVGLVLKLTKDGIAECKKYLLTSFEIVKNYMLNLPKSSYVFTIMAQPLQNNVPPICLAVFVTDNKFTASNVASRWQYTIKELEKRGIQQKAISSDGDSRCFRAMTDHINLHKQIATRSESNNSGNAYRVLETAVMVPRNMQLTCIMLPRCCSFNSKVM